MGDKFVLVHKYMMQYYPNTKDHTSNALMWSYIRKQ